MTPARKPKSARELAARALCRFDGHPEDIKFEGLLMWESYLPQADAVLEAMGLKSATGGVLEYIPVQAYHLLRRLGQGPVETKTLHGVGDEGIVAFLVSRGLAKSSGGKLVITPAGKDIGEIEDER
jgi:hypothetical protein